MKRYVLMLISVILIGTLNISAEDNTIEGLTECWETLWMKNYFTEEQMEDMVQQQQQAFTDSFFSYPWSITQTMWGVSGLNQEETLAYHLEMEKPNPNEGLRVYMLETDFKYAKQYHQAKNLKYLISDAYYWIAPKKRENVYTKYTKTGEHEKVIAEMRDSGKNIVLVDVLPAESAEFLKDYDRIAELMKEKGIGKVLNIKLISPESRLVFLYIETEEGEFLIKLYGASSSAYNAILPKMEFYEIYTVNEILEYIENIEENKSDDEWRMVERLQVNILATKPTYEAEAISLQNGGLLKGNDNGLDLLKPLTRAEAATMLLRALGVSETAANTTVQTFADVSVNHWSYGAVENAYSLGLINGMGDGTFAPDSLVTSVQFGTMVLRAANQPEFDWQEAINILIEKGVLSQVETETMDLFTRGDMAKIIYEAMEQGLF